MRECWSKFAFRYRSSIKDTIFRVKRCLASRRLCLPHITSLQLRSVTQSSEADFEMRRWIWENFSAVGTYSYISERSISTCTEKESKDILREGKAPFISMTGPNITTAVCPPKNC